MPAGHVTRAPVSIHHKSSTCWTCIHYSIFTDSTGL